jgi:hypothetical protein
MTRETAAQNINNQLKSSLKNEKMEELKRKPMHGQFCRDLQRPSVDKEKNPGVIMWLRSEGRNGEFENSNPRSSTQ